MKKIIVILIVLSSTNFLFAQEIKKMKIQELVTLIETSSTPLVINFWASWCGPCVREIPWFEKNVALFSHKKVKMLLVSIDFPDDYPKTIQNFAKKNGYRSEIIWLNETNADEFCPKIDPSWDGAIPVTLMINNQKKYRRFFPQQLPELKLIAELKSLTE